MMTQNSKLSQSAPLQHRPLWSTGRQRQYISKGRWVPGLDVLFSVHKETYRQRLQLSRSFPPAGPGWRLTGYFWEQSN